MVLTLEIPRLRALIVSRLEQKFSVDNAQLMADSVLFGELIGRPSHGIARILPGSYGPMDEELGPSPTVQQTGPAAARITGRPGMLVASLAAQLIIELASKHGMAIVSTTGSHSTSGSLTYYVEKLTSAGMVAFVSANTLSLVTPPGGKERILGTNPLAIGIPAVEYPFISDMATSAITGGEVIVAAEAETILPAGVAVDNEGTPTRNARAVLDGGALLPFGGHKGLGLSMMVELLNGVVAGTGSVPIGAKDDWSHVFVAISLAGLGDPDQLRQQTQNMIDRIRAAETRDGSEVRIPGHRSLVRRDAALAKGTVDVDRSAFEQLKDLV